MATSDQDKLRTLLAKIDELAGDDSPEDVCVDAVQFLDGNEDMASIGCNLPRHPGLGRFRGIVGGVRGRPDVAAVLAKITEVMGEDEWPFTDTLFVSTTAHPDVVAEWFEELSPDEVGAYGVDGLKGVPKTPPGYRWYSVWWD